MRIPSKWQLQKTGFNESSHIDFKNFMNFYKKCVGKPYSYLLINATPASDNPFTLQKEFLRENDDNW